jgi:uncharacterized membrane protein YfcA
MRIDYRHSAIARPVGLLVPTLVRLFGIDIKLACSLSRAVSLPTMLVGVARYNGDGSFQDLRSCRTFVIVMAAGSIVGRTLVEHFLGYVAASTSYPLLAPILLLSSIKVWRHNRPFAEFSLRRLTYMSNIT